MSHLPGKSVVFMAPTLLEKRFIADINYEGIALFCVRRLTLLKKMYRTVGNSFFILFRYCLLKCDLCHPCVSHEAFLGEREKPHV